jgi:hypothetical protein
MPLTILKVEVECRNLTTGDPQRQAMARPSVAVQPVFLLAYFLLLKNDCSEQWRKGNCPVCRGLIVHREGRNGISL